MSHEKNMIMKGLKTEIELDLEKSKKMDELEKKVITLKNERIRENQLTEQIITQENALKNIREMINICNQNPDASPYRFYPGNWAFQYPRVEGMNRLSADQKRVEQEQSVLKTQRKLARERQLEIINSIKSFIMDLPSLECFKI